MLPEIVDGAGVAGAPLVRLMTVPAGRKYSEVLCCAGDGVSGSRGVTRRAGCVICGA